MVGTAWDSCKAMVPNNTTSLTYSYQFLYAPLFLCFFSKSSVSLSIQPFPSTSTPDSTISSIAQESRNCSRASNSLPLTKLKKASSQRKTKGKEGMEGMKMKPFVALLVVVMAVCSVQKAAAADAPAPSPASDAPLFLPTFFASLAALAFAFFFSA